MDEQQALPQTKIIELEKPARRVEIRRYSALEGWDMRAAAIDYAMTEDRAYRRAFTLEVLRAATVDGKPLDGEEAVNTLLGTWQTLKFLFAEVLAFNQIDIEVKEWVSADISAAGTKMAVAMAAQFEQMAVLGDIAATVLKGEKAE